jgi:hypothetical protein
MLRIQPRLGKIRVCVFQQRILISMSKLFLQSDIPLRLVMLDFARALLPVLIGCEMQHDFHLVMNQRRGCGSTPLRQLYHWSFAGEIAINGGILFILEDL